MLGAVITYGNVEYMSASDIETFMKGFNLTTMYNSHLDARTLYQSIG